MGYSRLAREWGVLVIVTDPATHRGTFGVNATPVGPVGDVELVVEVGGSETTPYKAPGAVPPGAWNIQVWAALASEPVQYRLAVDAVVGQTEDAPDFSGPAVPSLVRVVRSGPAWFCGELHTHTTFSDGCLDPELLIKEARRGRAHFVAITDHNSTAAWQALAAAPDITLLPALEITLPGGHCNIYGLQRWLDWRVGYRGRTAQETLEAARAEGAVISINHPFAPGCSWTYDIPMAVIDCLEVVNYPAWWPASTEFNIMALGLWTSMLNAGHRITAVGGSDVFHLAPDARYADSPYPEAIMGPATCVYAANDSGAAIMDGLRRGSVYLTMGPTVRFEARSGSRRCGMGEHIDAHSGQLDLLVELDDVPAGCRLVLMKNGHKIAEDLSHEADVRYCFHDSLDPTERNWYRVDLFNAAGEIWTLTNPIYAGLPPQAPSEWWSQALARAHREHAIIAQTIFR
jgi:hypothetical protein